MIRSESLKGKIKNIAKSKKLSSQEVLQNISGLNFLDTIEIIKILSEKTEI